MRGNTFLILPSLLLILNIVAGQSRADSEFDKSVSVPLTERVYIFHLPPPFGRTSIAVKQSFSTLVQSISLESDAQSTLVNSAQFGRRVNLLEEPAVLYLDDAIDESGRLREFRVEFGYGQPKQINLNIPDDPRDLEIPGNTCNCVWVRSLLIIRMNEGGETVIDWKSAGGS